jgi:hypothetical protein
MKIPLSEQIDAMEFTIRNGHVHDPMELEAALSTLKWVERHQAEISVLAEFPGATVTVKEAGK